MLVALSRAVPSSRICVCVGRCVVGGRVFALAFATRCCVRCLRVRCGSLSSGWRSSTGVPAHSGAAIDADCSEGRRRRAKVRCSQAGVCRRRSTRLWQGPSCRAAQSGRQPGQRGCDWEGRGWTSAGETMASLRLRVDEKWRESRKTIKETGMAHLAALQPRPIEEFYETHSCAPLAFLCHVDRATCDPVDRT